MATATKKPRSTRTTPAPTRAPAAVRSTPSEFRVFEDNSGDFYWTIVSEDDAVLAQSGSFASFDDAERAAVSVRDGAASARLQERPSDTGVLVAT
jgi:uncharacterized protein YegP (UPF0339 family)